MTKIKSENDGKEVEVKINESIIEGCGELGVPFGCSNGVCGVCMIEVIEGEGNLQPLNDREKALGCNKKIRLACQCKIKEGDIKIKF